MRGRLIAEAAANHFGGWLWGVRALEGGCSRGLTLYITVAWFWRGLATAYSPLSSFPVVFLP